MQLFFNMFNINNRKPVIEKFFIIEHIFLFFYIRETHYCFYENEIEKIVVIHVPYNHNTFQKFHY